VLTESIGSLGIGVASTASARDVAPRDGSLQVVYCANLVRIAMATHTGHSCSRNRVDAVGMLRIHTRVAGILLDAFGPLMTASASGRQIAAVYPRLRILVGQNIMIAMTADTACRLALTRRRKFCVNACLVG